jgi:hypothetical protein
MPNPKPLTPARLRALRDIRDGKVSFYEPWGHRVRGSKWHGIRRDVAEALKTAGLIALERLEMGDIKLTRAAELTDCGRIELEGDAGA